MYLRCKKDLRHLIYFAAAYDKDRQDYLYLLNDGQTEFKKQDNFSQGNYLLSRRRRRTLFLTAAAAAECSLDTIAQQTKPPFLLE